MRLYIKDIVILTLVFALPSSAQYIGTSRPLSRQETLDSLAAKAGTQSVEVLQQQATRDSVRIDSLAEASYARDSTLMASQDSLATASADQDSVLNAATIRDSTLLDSLSIAGNAQDTMQNNRLDVLEAAGGGGGNLFLNGLGIADSTGQGDIDSLIIGESVEFCKRTVSKERW